MQIILSILFLFIIVNCLLKLSFLSKWQVALFGVVCGIFVALTYPIATEQSKTEFDAYMQSPEVLKNMAVLITTESVIFFSYIMAVLQGELGVKEKWWIKFLKWYPSLLIFPVLFFLQTELIFALPGVEFSTISYGFAAAVTVFIPALCGLFYYLFPERDMRLETHFLVTLFVCIIGLLTTVNGEVTYQASDQPTDWIAIGVALSLFVVFFLLGVAGNKFKWAMYQKLKDRKKARQNRL